MFQKGEHAESSTVSTLNSYQLSETSFRARITATIIREEAAESLLADVQGDAELVALAHVLNRYSMQWWLEHLQRVGADPVRYWRAQLGEEIKAAARGQNSFPQRKKFRWCFTARRKYDLVDLDLEPL